MKKVFVLISAIILGCGCQGPNSLSRIARELKDDPAFVTIRITTIYGSGVLVRDGRPNSSNVVSNDGATSVPGTNNVNIPPK